MGSNHQGLAKKNEALECGIDLPVEYCLCVCVCVCVYVMVYI